MGDTKRRRKKFNRPRKLYDKVRIEAENVLVEKYGLKNKREIWKAKTKISDVRRRAKNLIPKEEEEKKDFFRRLSSDGYKVSSISDVLALNEEDLLNRRLQTFVSLKKLANTPKQARQLIVHKHVMVGGKIVNIPSFHVSIKNENEISLKEKAQEKDGN